eukprot:TRINITY_DN9292_c0_g1_i5.p1 TRINITY_DN9292_c0_g1~~TRINITY_DN9292_c0_g1_i5.p1  ORF type:complete len:191 (+),score=43.35 TRINITY_DN9292_c0_g1_i5:64-573(+)
MCIRDSDISHEKVSKGVTKDVKDHYNSYYRQTFINQADVEQRKVAEIVGVSADKTEFIKTYPNVDAFLSKTQKQQLQQDIAQNFYQTHQETLEEAAVMFYDGTEQNPKMRIGEPIPGYTGVNRRVEADNVFGLSYAEARKKGGDSFNKLVNDRATNLKTQSSVVPPVKK